MRCDTRLTSEIHAEMTDANERIEENQPMCSPLEDLQLEMVETLTALFIQ